jgi:hypothetical protein
VTLIWVGIDEEAGAASISAPTSTKIPDRIPNPNKNFFIFPSLLVVFGDGRISGPVKTCLPILRPPDQPEKDGPMDQ